MTDHTRKSLDHEFELDPFVSEIARWIDQEVIAGEAEFSVIDLADRTARICLELNQKGVAIMTKPENVAVWVTTAEVKERIGDAGIAANSCFTRLTRADALLVVDQFQRTVRKHAKRRLARIPEFTETLFQLCNDGHIKIIGADSYGSYLWAPTFGT